MSRNLPLRGYVILIVEDDPLIGMDLAMTLEDNGSVVKGPYSSSDTAIAALRAMDDLALPDAALLDVDLGQQTSEAVARHLALNGVPFAFHTAQAASNDNIFDGLPAPVIRKPSSDWQIISAIKAIINPTSAHL